jgi:hypothetical protein
MVYAEGRAALASARRVRRLRAGYYSAAVRSLDAYYDAMVAIDVSDEIVRHAGDLAERHDLRGYDAVHLASALAVVPEGEPLVTWDAALAEAARLEGLAAVP